MAGSILNARKTIERKKPTKFIFFMELKFQGKKMTGLKGTRA